MRNLGVTTLASCLALASSAEAAEKLLVQDLTAQGVEAPAASALSTATCHQLAKQKAIEVLCGDDLRAMMQWNAMAASFNNCKDDSCFETSAKAMEAGLVVSGSVAKVGQDFVLSLTLFDVKQAKSLARGEVKAGSVEALYKQVPEAVQVLLEARKKR